MRALTFQGKQAVHYGSVEDPRLVSPQDVILKIELGAICGSDLHPYFEHERGLDPGTVMGHEAVGVIEALGPEVTHLRKGDRVFTPFTTCCGKCFYCRAGLTCRCTDGQLFGWREKGKGLHGLQAELARVPLADSTLMKVPDGILPEEALLLGDVLSTGFFCADRAELQPGAVCAVLGAGPVGLMAVLGAREAGAEKVFAIDPVAERRELAQGYGAMPLSPESPGFREAILEATGGRGADAVLDAVGNEAAARLAFELVRPGGVISTVGVSVAARFSFSPPEAYNKNLTYRVGRCPARRYMEKLIPLVRSRKYDLTPMLSHRLPLSEGARGYRIFAEKKERCTKVLLLP